MGYRPGYVHADTIKDVAKHYPRRNWSTCFSTKIREEVSVKPWCHTTALTEKFPNDTEKNVWEYVRLHSGTCQRRFCQGRSKAEVSFTTQLVGLAVHLIDEVANILD